MTDHVGLAIDPQTNDVYLTDRGELATVTRGHAVGQHVRQRLKTFEREWFLDTAAGVPWIGQLLGERYDPALAEAVIKAEILATDGVEEITSFSVNFARQTRNLNVRNVEVLTIYDEGVRV